MEQAEQRIASKLKMTCDPKIGNPNWLLSNQSTPNQNIPTTFQIDQWQRIQNPVILCYKNLKIELFKTKLQFKAAAIHCSDSQTAENSVDKLFKCANLQLKVEDAM